MNAAVPIINRTPELADCRDKWFFDEAYDCWCLEDVLYTMQATTPKFQRLSIFAPRAYLAEDGSVCSSGKCGAFTAAEAPVVFENSSAGYMQMPHHWLGGPQDTAPVYLERGMIYVTCGCRGRDSRDKAGKLCGKSPWTLVDLKTAIRFLRHNADVLPGNYDRIISTGWSAGGAMSSLLGTTGNDPKFIPYLEKNGAFMDERDDVFAAQAYCPITDLDHADLAYEWQFRADPENEASPAGPAGTMTPFQAALSKQLSAQYAAYFNSLGLRHPATGDALIFDPDGRSGTAYDYVMACLNEAAAKYLSKLENGELPVSYSVSDYLSGNYTIRIPAPIPGGPGGAPGGKDEIGLHHVGGAVMLPPEEAEPMNPPGLGDLMSRPPKGVPYQPMEPKLIDAPGDDKRSWLQWDGQHAVISDLDTYLLNHRRRMKPCTSFDTLNNDSGENQEFGTAEQDYMHFSECIAPAIASLQEAFPEEYARLYPAYAAAIGDAALAERRALINPMNFIGSPDNTCASHFRIRVGAQDADTSFAVSMALALKLDNAGIDTDYAIVWDEPHGQADFPGELCSWIETLCGSR